MSPFHDHRPRCLAVALALLAVVVRLLLPVLHEPRSGARHDRGEGDSSVCVCNPSPPTTPWWQLPSDDGGDADGDDERTPPPTADAASTSENCRACAEELLPLAAPAATAIVAPPAGAVRAYTPTPRPAPRCAVVRARHPCRAPPTTAA